VPSTHFDQNRLWLNRQPPNTVFRTRDLPHRHPEEVKAFADDPGVGVRRLAKGWYQKGAPSPGGGYNYELLDQVHVAFRFVGPGRGAGIADQDAVSLLGWSASPPASPPRICASAVSFRPPPGRRALLRRNNPRREALTPAEVTVLEAVKAFPVHADRTWTECVQEAAQNPNVLTDRMGVRLNPDDLIVRANALRWAAEREHPRPTVSGRVKELAAVLPPLIAG